MKAAFYTRNGPADEVLTMGERPKPKPGEGEVLVRVAFSGVNPSDVKSRAGRPLAGDHVIPHSDGSGTVEAVGEGVDAARIGERVWLWNGQWGRADGTCAEYIALPQAQAIALPDGVSLETGACLGIPGLTAAHAVNLLAREEGARSVLVTGAGNAVGNLACQMAKQMGLTVIGTASARRGALAGKLDSITTSLPVGSRVRRSEHRAVIDARNTLVFHSEKDIDGNEDSNQGKDQRQTTARQDHRHA